MSLRQKLEEALKEYPDAESVEISEDGKLATILSESFEGVDEAIRQEKVWEYLRGKLSEDELYSIEFVFTDTPKEHVEAA